MKQLLIILFLFVGTAMAAQETFAGVWTGVITQNEGGYRSEYYFEFHVNEITDEGVVYGKTYVMVDSIFAKMTFTGRIENGTYLVFREDEITRSQKFDDMYWCLKSGQLVLERGEQGAWRLEGFWFGTSEIGVCIPGKIHLKRGEPRV